MGSVSLPAWNLRCLGVGGGCSSARAAACRCSVRAVLLLDCCCSSLAVCLPISIDRDPEWSSHRRAACQGILAGGRWREILHSRLRVGDCELRACWPMNQGRSGSLLWMTSSLRTVLTTVCVY